MLKMQLLALLLPFVTLASAQFGFFDHMFNGGEQQQQQQPRNNPSDAGQYRSRHDLCMFNNQCYRPMETQLPLYSKYTDF